MDKALQGSLFEERLPGFVARNTDSGSGARARMSLDKCPGDSNTQVSEHSKNKSSGS